MVARLRLKFTALAGVTLVNLAIAQSSSLIIQSVVPQCAQQCLQQSINQTFSQICSDISNFTCLCTHYGSDGYSLGELALSCIYSNICGQAALQSTTAAYDICNQVSNAVTPTHSSVAGNIFGVSASSSSLPPNSTPTSTGDTVKPATSPAVSLQNPSKKLDSTQVAAVVIASIALLAVAITAAGLMFLRTRFRRRPAGMDEFKAVYSNSSHKRAFGSRKTTAGHPSHSQESQNSTGSSPARSSDGKPRTWPKYYRISPPTNIGLNILPSQSKTSIRSSQSKESSLKSSKTRISIKPDPSTDRSAIRVSGFISPPPLSEQLTPPEKSPFRTARSASVSIQTPETSNQVTPVHTWSTSRPGLESHPISSSRPDGERSRNLMMEISKAASAGSGSIDGYSVPLEKKSHHDSHNRQHRKRRSETSSTYSAVDSSPLANRPKRPKGESSGKRSSSKKHKTSSSKHGGRHSSSSSDRSGSTTETSNRTESRHLSPLAESTLPAQQNVMPPQSTTPNLATRSSQSSLGRSGQNSTPRNENVLRHTQSFNEQSLRTQSSSSIARVSSVGPYSTSSKYSRSTNGPHRYATNSALIAGSVQTPEGAVKPIYHYSREVEQQAAMLSGTRVSLVAGPVAGEPRHDGTYGFF